MSGVWAAAGAVVAATALAAVMVLIERRAQRDADQDMQEREYLPLIPEVEMRRVKALLKRISGLRGWDPSPFSMDLAWQRALAAVQTPDGGAWPLAFSPNDLEPRRLQLLAKVLDETFLCGALGRRLRQLKLEPLGFVVDDDFAGVCDWISYFAETNHIHLLRRKWCQGVNDSQPMSCEGVLCTSRLQVLMHTVAHEMVHAVVYNFWPDIDRASEAYLPCQRHGPIFKLLNKRLFGHASDSYHHVFQPLAASSAC